MEYTEVKNLGIISTGNTPSMKNPAFYDSPDIPFFKPSDISDNITKLSKSEYFISNNAREKARIFPKGTVLCTCIGIIGKIGIVQQESACNQQINYIIPNKNFVSAFIAYSLKSQKQKMIDIGKDAPIVPIINKTKFEKIQIPICSLTEQKRIVAELDNIEAGIRVKQEQLKALDELIQSRFTEMFGQRLLSARMLLSEIATFTIGLTYKPENVSEKGTIVLRSGNIQNNELALNDDIVRVANIKIPTEKFVKNQDILMCSRNGSAKLVGKSCLICNPTEQMAFGAFMTVIRTSYPYFLQSFFTSQFFKSQLTDVSTASVKQITSKMLKNYLVIKPRAEEERQFAEFVQQVERAKEIVKIQIKDLQELLALKMDEYFK